MSESVVCLRSLIKEAFPSVYLNPIRCIDGGFIEDSERARIRRVLANVGERRLTLDDLKAMGDFIWTLTAEGIHTVMPSVLELALTDRCYVDRHLEVLLFEIDPQASPNAELLALLTPKQRSVVSRCVRYLLESEGDPIDTDDANRICSYLNSAG